MSAAAAAAGRRPGNVDTKGEIIEAAKRVFAAKGYDGASLRAVAREAEVDPALVHHYFDGKASLFVAAMALPFDPRVVPMHEHPDASTSSSPISPGTIVINGFLSMWDHAEGTGSSFASCVAGMAASTNVADAMREFVAERIWEKTPGQRGRERRHDTSTTCARLVATDGSRLHPLHPPGAAHLHDDARGDRPLGRPHTGSLHGGSDRLKRIGTCGLFPAGGTVLIPMAATPAARQDSPRSTIGHSGAEHHQRRGRPVG